MNNLEFKGIKVVDLINELTDVSLGCINHVSIANYASRESDAKSKLSEKTSELYIKASKLDEINKDLLKALQEAQSYLLSFQPEWMEAEEMLFTQIEKAIEKALK